MGIIGAHVLLKQSSHTIKVNYKITLGRAVKIDKYLNLTELEQCVLDGFIRVAQHETLPLKLYTYTEKAQYEGTWPDAARKCRGLVVEDTGQIIAFCMPKFFNHSEHVNGKSYAPPLPERTDFEIFAKMDGSMGTVFFYRGQWHVASKGSFHSDQAKWATDYLNQKLWVANEEPVVGNHFDPLNRQKTYVCEIIYPENRIVVNYGYLEDLVLLTVFDNHTGKEELTEEHRLEWGWVGSVVPHYEAFGISPAELQLMADENMLLDEDNGDRTVTGTDHEGYVVRFADGTRCKIKLTDYLRLHKILTNCTERSIWEALSSGGSQFQDLLGSVPDEFYDWVMQVTHRLDNEHERLLLDVQTEFRVIQDILAADRSETRRDFAIQAGLRPFPSALFLMLDGDTAKLAEWAWKQIRPAATKPFRADENV